MFCGHHRMEQHHRPSWFTCFCRSWQWCQLWLVCTYCSRCHCCVSISEDLNKAAVAIRHCPCLVLPPGESLLSICPFHITCSWPLCANATLAVKQELHIIDACHGLVKREGGWFLLLNNNSPHGVILAPGHSSLPHIPEETRPSMDRMRWRQCIMWDIHADRHTYSQTCSSVYFAPLPYMGGEVPKICTESLCFRKEIVDGSSCSSGSSNHRRQKHLKSGWAKCVEWEGPRGYPSPAG